MQMAEHAWKHLSSGRKCPCIGLQGSRDLTCLNTGCLRRRCARAGRPVGEARLQKVLKAGPEVAGVEDEVARFWKELGGAACWGWSRMVGRDKTSLVQTGAWAPGAQWQLAGPAVPGAPRGGQGVGIGPWAGLAPAGDGGLVTAWRGEFSGHAGTGRLLQFRPKRSVRLQPCFLRTQQFPHPPRSPALMSRPGP